MQNTLTIKLSSQPAGHLWGNDNLLSFTKDSITVHVPDANLSNMLRRIQLAGRKVSTLGAPQVVLDGTNWDIAKQWAFYLGYKRAKDQSPLVLGPLAMDDQMRLQHQVKVNEWVCDLINQSPQQLTPEKLANSVIQFIQPLDPGAIHTELVIGEQLLAAGWQGVYHVGRGSAHPPVMLTLDFNPSHDPNEPVKFALVGKGVTFDSGGYTIKQNEVMSVMKCDMGGAATLAGALAQAIMLNFKERVQLILCCAENMVSSNAYKLGEIIEYKNGVRVEVLNTDAEGRLVMADGLIKASELKPKMLIDAATLTGAAITAVGSDYAAVFSRNPKLVQTVLKAAQSQNELCWPLPLNTWHQDLAPSHYADTANSIAKPGGGPAAASVAAGFLSRFVSKPENWVHFDLANAFIPQGNQLWAPGATGAMVNTIAGLLMNG